MKAMIFAAGLGTRLRPITDNKPKALAEISGIPLLEIVIRRLILFGYREIVVNVHHFADQVLEFLHLKKNFGVDIYISDERELLLDTGGGLKKAEPFFNDGKPFLVHNVDTITDINLSDYYKYHSKKGALATVLIRHRPGSRFFLFDEEKRLCGWENIATGKKIISTPKDSLEQIAFSCLHIIDPAIFPLLTEIGPFSIIDSYLKLASEYKIYGYLDDNSYWIDVGTPEKLERGSREIDLDTFMNKI